MGALQIAIDDALQLAPAFAAIFADRVYSLGTVPKDAYTLGPYVELGDSSERAAGYFAQGGNTNEETLTLVTARSSGKVGAGLALAALTEALDGQQLTMDGHRMLSGRVELVTTFADPDVETLRTVCRYTVLSWTSAA